MIKPPSEHPARRAPAAFSYEEDTPSTPVTTKHSPRKPGSFTDAVVLTADEDDPFLNPEKDVPPIAVALPRKRGTSFAKIAAAAFGVLFSLAFGLWTDSLIRNLFSRADWLGYAALAALAIGILAVIAIVVRETAGMMRLAAVQEIKAEAEAAMVETKPAKARALVKRLESLLSGKPEMAKGRATLKAAEGDIIDPPHLIALAERELLAHRHRSRAPADADHKQLAHSTILRIR